MRREQVLKICLNHALVPDNMYKPKDERTWFFVANDFSEGEVMLQQFCIRFANKEIATQFKDAIDKALREKFGVISNQTSESNSQDSEDVIFITEIQATNEEKEKAKELMLPENFFTYKNKETCKGCRGCDKDEDTKNESDQVSRNQHLTSLTKQSSLTTPLKTSTFNFQSPNNSLYGTPNNFNNTIDTTIFRTPLSTNGSNTKSSSNTTGNLSNTEDDSTDKENTLTDSSPNVIKPVSFVSAGQLSSTSTVLAPPKFTGINVISNSNGSSAPESVFGQTEAKSIFGSTETKSIFGQSNPVFGESKSIFGESKPLFGLSSVKPAVGFNLNASKIDTQSNDVKSIFSADGKPSVNLFSGNSQGSLFGPAALKSSQPGGIFGNTATFTFGTAPAKSNENNPELSVKPEFSSGKPGDHSLEVNKNLFSNLPKNNGSPWDNILADKPKAEDNLDKKSIEPKKSTEAVVLTDNSANEKTPFTSDNALTFAALSSSVSGFGIQS